MSSTVENDSSSSLRHIIRDRALRTTRMSSSSSSSSTAADIPVEATQSSCTWTQRSVNDQCVLKPRSCYNCLNTLPSNGEICALAPDGVCKSMAAYDESLDYQRPGQAAAWPPRLNFFTANATYCESGDRACASCRDKSFQSWRSYASQYCEGAKGCVCVAICEADQWETAIQPALQATLQQQQTTNGSFLNCTVNAIPTNDDSSTASSSGAVDFVGLSLSTKDVLASADECRWYQNQTYCGAPRTCYDCLNTPIYSGNKCMLHSSGYCTSMAAYDYTKYYGRTNQSRSTVLFPSINTSYCEPNDPICQQCKASSAFTQWTNATSRAEFCIGTGGCVCVASCESPQWKSIVVELTCNTSAVQKAIAADVSSVPRYAFSPMQIILSCVLSILCVIAMFLWHRRNANPTAARPPPPPRSPNGPVLELSGWKAMREKLIETERDFAGESSAEAANITTTTTTTHHLDQRLLPGGRVASAGAATTEVADSVPIPTVLVEEGNAYRPLSPSRMHQ